MALGDFYKALLASGVGILSIFAFMLLFYLTIFLLEKLFPGEDESEFANKKKDNGN